MPPKKRDGWRIPFRRVLVHCVILVVVCRIGRVNCRGDFSLTKTYPDCYVDRNEYYVTCQVNRAAITAEGCLVINSVTFELIKNGSQTIFASCDYPSCNKIFNKDNCRCKSNDTDTNVYEVKFRADAVTQRGMSLRCWSDCFPSNTQGDISLTAEFNDSNPIPFRNSVADITDVATALLCVGGFLIVGVIVGVIIKSVLCTGAHLGIYGILGIAFICLGSVCLIIAGSLIITDGYDGSICVFSTTQIVGIIFSGIGGTILFPGFILTSVGIKQVVNSLKKTGASLRGRK